MKNLKLEGFQQLSQKELIEIEGGGSFWDGLPWYRAGKAVGYSLGWTIGRFAKALDMFWEKV